MDLALDARVEASFARDDLPLRAPRLTRFHCGSEGCRTDVDGTRGSGFAAGLRGRQKAFGQFLEKQLRAEWHVIIMLAYLEIALATAMGIDQGPTDLGFWELGDSWSRA